MPQKPARTRLDNPWKVLVCVGVGATACTYDFDQFSAQGRATSGGTSTSTETTAIPEGGTGQPGGGSGATVATGGTSPNASSASSAGGSKVGSSGTSGTNTGDGPFAHFAFDEVTGDIATNRIDTTKNGRYVGACTHPAGRIDGAVGIRNISGSTSSEWIELPTGLLSGLATATLSIWVRDLSTTRNGGRLFHFSKGSTDEIYFAPDQVNPSTSRAGGHLGGAHAGTAFVDLWTATPTLTDKVWHQIAITWSAASIDLYIDGSLAGRKADPGVVPSDLGATSPDWLGRTRDDTFIALYAEIDDLRLYSRVLLASEIAQLYRQP